MRKGNQVYPALSRVARVRLINHQIKSAWTGVSLDYLALILRGMPGAKLKKLNNFFKCNLQV